MRTVFVQSGLGAGGAEKIVNMLAHHRLECGDKVDVIAVNVPSTQSYFAYDEAIAVHALGSPGTQRGGPAGRLAGAVTREIRLRRKLKTLQADVVLSFLTKINVMVGIATLGHQPTVIMSERNNFAIQKMHPAWQHLRSLAGRRATQLVMQTEAARNALPAFLRKRAVIIPNPVTLDREVKRPGGDPVRFVAVGRLDSQKGFDLLLEAFARVVREIPEASLVIFGEGSERAALTRQAGRLKIADRVSFPGVTQAPQDWLEAGNVFVLSSRFEGFPNVLLEALTAGMATISFACPWGPSEILSEAGELALVPPGDVEALANSLVRVAKDCELRRQLEDMAPRMAAPYSKAKIFAKWDALIYGAAASHPGRSSAGRSVSAPASGKVSPSHIGR